MRLEAGGEIREVTLELERARVGDGAHAVRVVSDGAGRSVLEVDGKVHRVRAVRRGDRVFVWCDGETWELSRSAGSRRAAHPREDLVAPMTGRVRKLLVSAGDAVEPGRPLVILEAMKMEHTIRAPRAGTVRDLPHREGDLVDAGTPLVEIG